MKAQKKAHGRLFKRGTTYYLRWRADGKEETQRLLDAEGKPITTLPAAEAARAGRLAYLGHEEKADQDTALLAHRETAAETARKLDAENRAVKLTDGWERFAALPHRREPSDQTLAQYRAYWQDFVVWMGKRWPDTRLVIGVTAENAAEYAATLARAAMTPRTFNARISALRMVSAKLRTLDNETGTPFAAVELRRDSPLRREVVSPESFRKLFAAAPVDLKPLLLMAYYTGQRMGDLALCKWPDLDLTAGVWRMTQRKTGAGLLLPLPDPLRRELGKVDTDLRKGFLMPEVSAQYKENRRWLVKRIMDVFEAVYGAETMYHDGKKGKRRPKYSLHSLRHTFNTTLLESNAGAHTVRALTGHSTDAMTARYAHVGLPALRQAVAALPDVCGGKKARKADVAQLRKELAAETKTATDAGKLRAALAALR